MPKKKLSFEESADKLANIIDDIENNNVTLEDSIKLYKEGIDLYITMNETLNRYEQEIMELSKKADGAFQLEPFDDDLTSRKMG